MKYSTFALTNHVIFVDYNTAMIIRVSGQFTLLLDQWLHSNGLQTPALKQRLAQLAQRATVPVELWREVLAEAAEVAPHRHFGLEVGSLASLKHIGVLGFLVANSETLAEGLRVYQMSERRFYSVNFARLTQSGNSYRLSWVDNLGDINGLFVQVALATLVTFLRQRFPATFRLHQVALTENLPADPTPYKGFFGCPVSFTSNDPGIEVDFQLASRPETGKLPSSLNAVKSQQHDAFSSAIGSQQPFLRGLQPLLLKMIPQGEISLTAVAREMDCSPRTLQRRLGEYGFTYQSLLDAVREQLAYHYLQDSHLGYAEMALLLGFSEQSAFNRAFKHWTGQSPGRYQEKQTDV